MTAAMGHFAFIFVQWIEMETRHFDLLLLGHIMDKLRVQRNSGSYYADDEI